MPYTYRFTDATKTTVVRNDGEEFPWDPTRAATELLGAYGTVMAEYLADGCPVPADSKASRSEAAKDEEAPPAEALKGKKAKAKKAKGDAKKDKKAERRLVKEAKRRHK
jgi:hypothetical protein